MACLPRSPHPQSGYGRGEAYIRNRCRMRVPRPAFPGTAGRPKSRIRGTLATSVIALRQHPPSTCGFRVSSRRAARNCLLRPPLARGIALALPQVTSDARTARLGRLRDANVVSQRRFSLSIPSDRTADDGRRLAPVDRRSACNPQRQFGPALPTRGAHVRNHDTNPHLSKSSIRRQCRRPRQSTLTSPDYRRANAQFPSTGSAAFDIIRDEAFLTKFLVTTKGAIQ